MNKEELRRTIGRNIVALRKEYGISRASLAKLIRIPVGRLRRVEQGDINAALYDFHVKRIARVFDVSADSLFGLLDHEHL